MKTLREYINEALRPEVQKWLKQVYDTMQKLIKNNKLQTIAVDPKKLAKPQKGSFKFDDFITDNIAKMIINDKVLGFPIMSQMIINKTKYFIDTNMNTETELKPECLPYWYQDGDKVYFIGIIMFDPTVTYIDNFCHIVAIETSLCVAESTPILKAMITDFSLHYLNKIGKFMGLTAKPQHPKLKAPLIKIGFTSSKDNKDILTYKL